MLGSILERVYAHPLASVVEDKIARPLALRDLTLLPRPGGPYAPLHRRSGSRGFVPVDDESVGLSSSNPGQAGVSTASDMGLLYADLLRSLRGEGVLLARSTIGRLLDSEQMVQLYDLGRRRWALGFQRDLPIGILGSGWSPNTFGHLGTAPRSIVALYAADPVADRVIALKIFSVSGMNDHCVRQLTAVMRRHEMSGRMECDSRDTTVRAPLSPAERPAEASTPAALDA